MTNAVVAGRRHSGPTCCATWYAANVKAGMAGLRMTRTVFTADLAALSSLSNILLTLLQISFA